MFVLVGGTLDLMAKLKCEPLPPGAPSTATTVEDLLKVPGHPGYEIDIPESAKDDPYACLAEESDPPASTVNDAGIKTIRWTKDLGVESIETADGRTLYPVSPPNRWLYLLAAFLPLLGFFLPWGLVRALCWVGDGFTATQK